MRKIHSAVQILFTNPLLHFLSIKVVFRTSIKQINNMQEDSMSASHWRPVLWPHRNGGYAGIVQSVNGRQGAVGVLRYWDHSNGLGQHNTELLVGHTGLRGALSDLVGEGSDALARNGSQREGVLRVCSQTFHHIVGPGVKALLFLLAQETKFIWNLSPGKI